MKHKGYIYVLKKEHPYADRDGYVLEHRLVMEESIGRFLLKEEIVHHINEIRDDNRIENLKLLPSQSAHMIEHDLGHMNDWTKKKHPWIGRRHSEKLKAHWSKIRKGKKPIKGAKIAPTSTS